MVKYDAVEHKVPLYGPLNITDEKTFYEKTKETFFLKFNTPFHDSTDINNFEKLFVLGQGAFGTVKLVKSKSSPVEYYAVKVINKQRVKEMCGLDHVAIEKRFLQSIDFPFFVCMLHYTSNKNYIYFLMPFIEGGELFTHLVRSKRFLEPLARFYAAQVVLALEFMQYIHFVYRDLKPENILVDHKGFLKLSDFGLAKQVESRTYTICGTPPYMAPEIVQGIGYARSADWWSLGILIYEMTTGITPFAATDPVRLFTKIMYAPFMMPSKLSSELQKLLRKLLTKDVSRRIGNLKGGAEDVKSHDWFKGINWLRLLNRQVLPPFVPICKGQFNPHNFPRAKPCTVKKDTENEDDDEFDDF